VWRGVSQGIREIQSKSVGANSMGILDGKVALVTGSGRGIGRAIALDMAKAGAKVVVNDLGAALDGGEGSAGPAEETAQDIQKAGGEAAFNTDSVSDPQGAKRMVEAAMDAFGAIDCVVNVAGILRDGMFHRMETAQWQAVLDVHLNGCFNVSRAAVEHMREKEAGSFVHFTSTSGLVGQIGQANYAAAKMGIMGLSRVIAMEGASKGIRSNCVAPFAWTRMIESIPIKSEEQARAFEAFRTGATAEHVAPVVSYLCSDSASGINGQVFGVRGNEIYLFNQPRPVKTIHNGAGWTHEALAATVEPSIRNELTSLDGTGEYFSWDPI
jgi:NAD(P)-dependent dehydrogenase (short-subunit alcohol dehydrogenase family)